MPLLSTRNCTFDTAARTFEPVSALRFGVGEMVSVTFEAVSVVTDPALRVDGLAATDPTDGVPPMYIFLSDE
jgi:hypothetical protein